MPPHPYPSRLPAQPDDRAPSSATPAPTAQGIAPLAMSPEAVPPSRRRRWMRRIVIAGTLASLPLARTGLPRTETATAGTPPLASATGLAEDRLLLTMAAPSERRTDEAIEEADAAEAEALAAARAAPAPMAEVDGVPLVVPADPGSTALVGFHEANGASTQPLTPSVALDAEHNGGVEAEAGDPHPDQPDAVVLPSRARGSHPASAVDIAVPEGVEVTAPVTGEVVGVSPYALYGKYPDTRIEIVPEGRPDLRVIVLHVTDPLVSVGDELTAGETPLAGGPTALPFASQIDRFTTAGGGEVTPHVHIEVKRTA